MRLRRQTRKRGRRGAPRRPDRSSSTRRPGSSFWRSRKRAAGASAIPPASSRSISTISSRSTTRCGHQAGDALLARAGAASFATPSASMTSSPGPAGTSSWCSPSNATRRRRSVVEHRLRVALIGGRASPPRSGSPRVGRDLQPARGRRSRRQGDVSRTRTAGSSGCAVALRRAHRPGAAGAGIGAGRPYMRRRDRTESATPHVRTRHRSQPLFRPRRALCPRRGQCRRGRGADRRRAAVRARRAQPLQCRGAGQGAGRAEGPDHEGGAARRHHPRCGAAGICRRAAEAAVAGAADGRGLRQAPDDGGARRRLARALRRLRPQAGGGGLARPGASRDDAGRRRRSPASCNIRTWNRRSRPTSRSSTSCSRCTGAWTR